MKTKILPVKKTLFRVVFRPANAKRMSSRLIVADNRKSLTCVLRTMSVTEFVAEEVVEVFA